MQQVKFILLVHGYGFSGSDYSGHGPDQSLDRLQVSPSPALRSLGASAARCSNPLPQICLAQPAFAACAG